MRPVVARVTSANPTSMISLDTFHGAALAVQVVLEGGAGSATYHLDYSFDNPNDLIFPVPLANMSWDNTLVPTALKAGTAGGSGYIASSPIWGRLQWLTGASVRAIFTQYEAHRSYSVGPPMATSQMLTLPQG